MIGGHVVGIDGTRGGWVAVELAGGAVASVGWLRTDELAGWREWLAGAAVIAIDMPIGLLPGCPPEQARDLRAADDRGRQALGRRAATLFPVPPRPVFAAGGWGRGADGDSSLPRGYAAANAASKQRWGRGISRQLWGIADRIHLVDDVARAGTPFREVHPELSFMALRGECEGPAWTPLSCSKHTRRGRDHRRTLLEAAGIHLPRPGEGLARIPVGHVRSGDADPRLVPEDDVLDAAVAAWTALRIARGASIAYGRVAAQQDDGRAIVIHA